MASFSELACIYSALILHDDYEVTDEALANVNIGSLICNVRPGGPAPAVGAPPAGSPALSTAAAPAEEKKVEAKKEEFKETDNNMGFDLFD
ncbi:60S acidic ribosomal protein P1-like isoform X2 [Arvicola amphibius]|uniref:60S acidic ribosomal protein P1-like isoform X2 n=1 Tax=Arvicola amphibius TaxID=1047088 RepID=UPI0018E29D51|nr:60S acidic ribosomal protein P1-like isoform X2 [Arvicola amphibius]